MSPGLENSRDVRLVNIASWRGNAAPARDDLEARVACVAHIRDVGEWVGAQDASVEVKRSAHLLHDTPWPGALKSDVAGALRAESGDTPLPVSAPSPIGRSIPHADNVPGGLKAPLKHSGGLLAFRHLQIAANIHGSTSAEVQPEIRNDHDSARIYDAPAP